MPNPIKYTTGSGSLALKKGNFLFGTGDVGKGPSDTTGYYQAVDVPKPGYVVYQYLDNVSGNLTYATFTGDTEFINFTNGLAGQTFTSTTQCLVYYRGQSDKICFNRDYEPIITDGLILNTDAGFDGSYPESGTTWTDLSLSGNNGTLINGPGYYANGGGGIVFDGANDSINIPSLASNSFTYNLWFKKTSTTSTCTSLISNEGTLLRVNNTQIQWWSNVLVGSVNYNFTPNLNQWYNITVVQNNTNAKIYLDTNLIIDTTTSLPNTTFGRNTIGSWGGSCPWLGSISSTQIYNRALTSSEVLQNYNAMKDRFAFIFSVDTTKTGVSTSTQFKLPLVSSGSINFVVEWGDGTTSTITTFNQAETTHTYPSGGVYEIKIRGVLKGWQFNSGGDKLKMGEIKNWGCLDISVDRGFYGCTNMTCVATDAPTISSTSLNQYFSSCSNFNGPVGNWDVSNVTSMSDLFYSCGFNQNIGAWNVEKVTTMSQMFMYSSFNNGGSPSINNWRPISCSSFYYMFGFTNFNQPIENWPLSASNITLNYMFRSSSFNQPLSGWNTSNVVNMGELFFQAGFNQPIGNWDTSNNTNFSRTFYGTGFNHPIGNWNTSNVTNMSSMFQGSSFNQDIGSWDVSNVTNMSVMFYYSSFNNGGSSSINNWNTSKVTNMSSMFMGSSFNQNIGSWNVSNVTNFSAMFRQMQFNNGGSPSISGWTMSAATTLNNMFRGNGTFNQPIGSWDTRNVTDIGLVLEGANSFNQNIGTWDTSKFVGNALGRSLRSGSFNNGGSPDINNWNLSGINSLGGVFWDASLFNQPIKDWNITGVTTAANFFTSGSQYSTANYDDILNTWSQKNVRTGVTINFASIKYSSAGAAGRATLVNTYGWTITDGGQI